jgi:tetratricopeptide (TPR) repeat protein
MSRKLNLVDRLLAMGRRCQELGRDHDARHVLGRLAGFGELPAAVAEETQARLAELDLKRGRFRRARRHLTAALFHRPDHARYHYLLAGALDADGRGDPQRAVAHYRKSLELDPNQPRCLGEFGLLALRLGQTDEGLAVLRRAAELAPADPEAVGRLVDGLRQEGRTDEARGVLRAARFRNPRDARFHRLWSDFEFHLLRQEQQARRHADHTGQPADDGPVLLPFVRPAPETAKAGRKVIRRDGASPPTAPHLSPSNRRPGQRRAQ